MLRIFSNSRTFTDNLKLGVFTAIIAGMVNVASVVLFYSFTSNLTGHFAIFAQEIAIIKPTTRTALPTTAPHHQARVGKGLYWLLRSKERVTPAKEATKKLIPKKIVEKAPIWRCCIFE